MSFPRSNERPSDAVVVAKQIPSYVVTGGAGFIGSRLCAALLRQGCQVYCIDDFSTGAHSNLLTLRNHDRFNYLAWDICRSFETVAPRCDVVINLACPASPRQYQSDKVHTALTCALGTLNALTLAARHKATFLQASTSEIYGDPDVHPQHEDYRGNVNPIGPRACYDEGKRFAETLVTDFCTEHRLNGRIARIFNTYGPGMQLDDGRVVSNFVTQALSGNDITIYGDGLQTRSFCYVDDTIQGLLSLARAPVVSGPINIGNPVELTVMELAQAVLRMTKSPAKVVNVPLPVDDPRRRKPDISRAIAELNWRPRTSLATGLRRTIADFQARMEGVRAPVRHLQPPSSAFDRSGQAAGLGA